MADGILWDGVGTAELERQWLLAQDQLKRLQASGQVTSPEGPFWQAVAQSGQAEWARRGLRPEDLGRLIMGNADQPGPSVAYMQDELVYVRHPPLQAFDSLYEPVTRGVVEGMRRDGGVEQVLIRFNHDAISWVDAAQVSRADLHQHYDGLWEMLAGGNPAPASA